MQYVDKILVVEPQHFILNSRNLSNFQNELREGSNEEEEEDLDEYIEEIPQTSPNGLKIHITSDSQDEDQFSELRH